MAEIPQQSASDFVEVEVFPPLEDLAAEPSGAIAHAEESEVEEPPLSKAEVGKLLALQEAESPELPEGFVISITMGGKCRRLNFAGGCFRIPSEHYRKFEVYDQKCLGESLYTHRCKD